MLRARFSPITARPIMPMFAVFGVCSGVAIFSPSDECCFLPGCRARDGHGLADDLKEAAQARGHVRADLDADGAAAALRERVKVAECLRLLERREGERLAGNLDVARVR